MSPVSNCDFGIEYAMLSGMPSFSIIIAIYNDWEALEGCLDSLILQTDEPDFEVIVVDDGSHESATEAILEKIRRLGATLVAQSHAGISAARNHGIRISRGLTLLFVDADCRLQSGCLAALAATIVASPLQNYFQLRLIGDCARLVGKTEHLRLTTLQKQLLEPDGRIRYLNTAGFAVRRAAVPVEIGLFDESAIRAEDTLMLANLIERSELPFFVSDAIVRHDVCLSLSKCLRKDVRSAWVEGSTYALITSRGINIRMGHRDRLNLLLSMWQTSRLASIGRLACLGLILRQSSSRTTSLVYRLLHRRPGVQRPKAASLKGTP
jgi:glycosyltransferase involved in cell wall biosynthesis